MTTTPINRPHPVATPTLVEVAPARNRGAEGDATIRSNRADWLELPAERAPSAEQLLRLLRADLSNPEGRGQLMTALQHLQRVSTADLLALGPEALNELFAALVRAGRELAAGADGQSALVAVLATLGLHLDWRSNGAELYAALEPSVVEGFAELARAADAGMESYAAFRARALELQGSWADDGAWALLPELGPGGEDLGLQGILDFMVRQLQVGGERARDPRVTGVGIRSLAMAAVRMAEDDKAMALAALGAGELSQEKIMQLQEQLQSANNVMAAFNEILKKENDLIEAIIRNFA